MSLARCFRSMIYPSLNWYNHYKINFSICQFLYIFSLSGSINSSEFLSVINSPNIASSNFAKLSRISIILKLYFSPPIEITVHPDKSLILKKYLLPLLEPGALMSARVYKDKNPRGGLSGGSGGEVGAYKITL